MKRTRVAMAGALALAGAALMAPSATAAGTYVDDPALDACFAAAVAAAGSIDDVTEVNCANQGVESLAGIEQFAGQLTEMELSGNKITDLTPLDAFKTAGVEFYAQVYSQTVTLNDGTVGVHQAIFTANLPEFPEATASVDKPAIVTPDADFKGWTFTAAGTAKMTITNYGTPAGDLHVNYSGTVTQTAVWPAPEITTPPGNKSVDHLGDTATFTATAATGNPDYTATWQFFDEDAGAWTALPTDPSLFAPTDDGTTFSLGVTAVDWSFDGLRVRLHIETDEGEVTSSAATLTVAAAPELVSGLGDVTVNEGDTATMTAVFNSTLATDPTATWEVSEDGGTSWEAVPAVASVPAADRVALAAAGAYSMTLTLSDVTADMDGLMFRVTAANAYGSTSSAEGTLTVIANAVDPTTPSVPVVTSTSGAGTLSQTGSDTLPVIGLAAALLLVGTAIVVVARRRRSA